MLEFHLLISSMEMDASFVMKVIETMQGKRIPYEAKNPDRLPPHELLAC